MLTPSRFSAAYPTSRPVLMSRLFGLVLLLCLPWNSYAQPDWETPPGFSSSMTVIATLDLDGEASTDAADLLAAFVGDEVRGVSSPLDLGDVFVYFLTVVGDLSNETVSFKAYDASTNQERTLCEKLNFRIDAVRGSVLTPYALYAADGAGQGTCPLHWHVASGYDDQMTIYAALFLDGTRSGNPDDLVAAFAGEEVRGVGVPFEVGGEQVYLLNVSGDINGEALTFRVYGAIEKSVYATIETVLFFDAATEGAPGTPVMLTTTPLPVELVSFEALLQGSGVILKWQTLSETNNAGFEIQREEVRSAPSAETHFQTLGFVTGVGATRTRQSYDYRVVDLPPGRHRFRLKQVDFDGAFTYSPVVEVFLTLPEAYTLTVAYPNPFNPLTQFTLAVSQAQHVAVSVYDVLGREVARLFAGKMTANEVHRLEFRSGYLPDGLYLIRVAGEYFNTSQTVTLLK
jgi:hypothetical protein